MPGETDANQMSLSPSSPHIWVGPLLWHGPPGDLILGRLQLELTRPGAHSVKAL